MPKTTYLQRRAVTLENEHLRVTVVEEGGHIAEVFHKAAGVNPLWTPSWAGREPSAFGSGDEQEFGNGVEGKLLRGILGHNLCLDLFGGPSDAEFAAGMTAHGEGSVLPYELSEVGNTLTCSLHMPLAQLRFQRTLTLSGEDVHVQETVENLAAFDRPLAWTQHVTLGKPFLDPATTDFRMTGDRAATIAGELGAPGYLAADRKFAWPYAPLADGSGSLDARRMKPDAPASSYIAVRMVPQGSHASWTAWSPEYRLAISYVWNREDFPWLGLWEENCARSFSPWNSAEVARGLEFGTSPFPESRRATVERGRLLDTPCYRWLPALDTLETQYWIRTRQAGAIPEVVGSPA
ncbi:MAG: hypothetical protein ACRYGF_03950 [Janthinobacterium lividum]